MTSHVAGVIGHAEAGGPQIEVYRWPGEDDEAEDSDDDDEGECESARSRRFNRLGGCLGLLHDMQFLTCFSGYHDSDVEEFDESSVASLTPESTPGGSPASTAALSGDDSGIAALSLSEVGGFSDADFRSECTQSLDRAFEEGHAVENAAIELKTLRMASNVPLTAVKEVITAFLVSKIPLKDNDQAGQKKAVNAMISRWGSLLSAIGSESPVENVLLLQVSAHFFRIRRCSQTMCCSRIAPARRKGSSSLVTSLPHIIMMILWKTRISRLGRLMHDLNNLPGAQAIPAVSKGCYSSKPFTRSQAMRMIRSNNQILDWFYLCCTWLYQLRKISYYLIHS